MPDAHLLAHHSRERRHELPTCAQRTLASRNDLFRRHDMATLDRAEMLPGVARQAAESHQR
jgi:hypothetical protein